MEIYDAGEIRKVGKGLSVPSKRRAGPRGVARKATGRHRNYPAPGRGRKQAMRSRGSEREEKSRLLSHAGRWGRVQNGPRGQETSSGPASPAALPSGGAVSPSRPSRCCARRWGGFQTILFPSCSFESDIIRLYHLVGMLSSSCRPTTRHPLTPTTIRQTKTTPASLTSPAPALPTTPPTLSAHLLASLDPTCIQLAEVSTALILPPLHCPSFPGVGSPLFYPMVKAHGFCVAV